ncbi:nucleotide exchange factor GrpE [Nocardioides carbamazepini]|uniref:nucleotide exchange factor GrpE n=1 Tax=Nocardioides carbamazepini TaxID=2854259 RepID=UPI00214A4010|nr:nucleotide exchange factor GrpE [Nocardioides carbamazepini]MCR1784843.1 nucleotide exchange factor GrpE [Nocardioides carbamazepini]
MTEENLTPEGEPQETAAPSPEGQEAEAAPAAETDEAAEAAEAVETAEAAEVVEAAEATPEADELTVTRMELEERTLDLQRLQAEFLNYKRRVERDRELLRENATYAALTPIIDVLDTIDRARDHEPLEGGFKATAEQLERVVAGLGLVKFGEAGDAFDPTIHEALSHIGTDAEVEVTTCKVIAKSGYKMGDRVVRAAQVLVVDPAEG